MFSKEKITVAYTEEKCAKCNRINKRKFSVGDYLFTESSRCDSCGNPMMIEKIFGEILDK